MNFAAKIYWHWQAHFISPLFLMIPPYHTHVVVVRRNSKVLRRLRLWWIQLLFYWHSIWRRWLLPMFLDFKWGIIIRYVIRIQTLQKLAFESGGNLLYRFTFKGKFTLLKFARALESLKVRTLCNFEKKISIVSYTKYLVLK